MSSLYIFGIIRVVNTHVPLTPKIIRIVQSNLVETIRPRPFGSKMPVKKCLLLHPNFILFVHHDDCMKVGYFGWQMLDHIIINFTPKNNMSRGSSLT